MRPDVRRLIIATGIMLAACLCAWLTAGVELYMGASDATENMLWPARRVRLVSNDLPLHMAVEAVAAVDRAAAKFGSNPAKGTKS